jgi:hypothetical protein
LLLGNQKRKKTIANSIKEFFGHNGPKAIGLGQWFLACHQNITRFLNPFAFLFGL